VRVASAGGSAVAASGYDMDTLTSDAVGLIEALGCAPCHFVGLSMGGFVGQRLAIRHPHLLKSLILMETSADPEPKENLGSYRLMGFIARRLGMRPLVTRVMKILFSRTFMAYPARHELREQWRVRLLANDRIGATRALRGVLDREATYGQLDRISVPTLIMVGDEDIATTPAVAERMHERIAGSKLVVIPHAGHTSSVEAPEVVNETLAAFLASVC